MKANNLNVKTLRWGSLGSDCDCVRHITGQKQSSEVGTMSDTKTKIEAFTYMWDVYVVQSELIPDGADPTVELTPTWLLLKI